MSTNLPQKDTLRSFSKNIAYLIFSLTSYALCLLTLLYLIGFLAKIAVPKHIDSGIPSHWATAIVINIFLISLFAFQHSTMARKGIKLKLKSILPPAIERATFVLFSSAALILLFYFWQPLPTLIWSVEPAIGRMVLNGLYWAGWFIVIVATFLISHFELFGITQTLIALRDAKTRHSNFKTPSLYKLVRHPMYLGFVLAFWATPDMSAGHLLFALSCTVYIIIGTHLEERDLLNLFGDTYKAYQQQTGMLFPSIRKRRRERNADGS